MKRFDERKTTICLKLHFLENIFGIAPGKKF